MVEAEVADIGAAAGVDHHVIAPMAGMGREVAMDGQRAGRSAASAIISFWSVIETTINRPSGAQPRPEAGTLPWSRAGR